MAAKRRGGLTPKQADMVKRLIKAIHSSPAWRTVYSTDRTMYEALIRDRYGDGGYPEPPRSAKDLRIDDLVDLNNFMWGNPSRRRPPEFAPPPQKRTGSRGGGNVSAIITPAQRAKMAVLVDLVIWHGPDGLGKWCMSKFGFVEPRTDADANRVIEGLKKIFENQMLAAYGPEWASQRYDDIRIMRYIQIHCKPGAPAPKGAQR